MYICICDSLKEYSLAKVSENETHIDFENSVLSRLNFLLVITV